MNYYETHKDLLDMFNTHVHNVLRLLTADNRDGISGGAAAVELEMTDISPRASILNTPESHHPQDFTRPRLSRRSTTSSTSSTGSVHPEAQRKRAESQLRSQMLWKEFWP
jgi:hypothetical protein